MLIANPAEAGFKPSRKVTASRLTVEPARKDRAMEKLLSAVASR
jgi:hypothetical protein